MLQSKISRHGQKDDIAFPGFGHVKERNVEQAKKERMELRAGFKNVGGLQSLQAAE